MEPCIVQQHRLSNSISTVSGGLCLTLADAKSGLHNLNGIQTLK